MVCVTAYFDCSSPWTYMGFENLRRLRAELGFDIEWKPILVGGIFNSINDSVYQFRSAPIPAKEAYIAKDMQDWARHGGFRINWRPSIFPINSARAMRGCIVADESGLLEPYALAVFESYWSEDQDIRDPLVLAAICERAGLDSGDHLARIEEPTVKQRLRDNTDELMARGGYGTPTFFVGDNDMYFGNDRLTLLRAAIEALHIQASAGR